MKRQIITTSRDDKTLDKAEAQINHDIACDGKGRCPMFGRRDVRKACDTCGRVCLIESTKTTCGRCTK